MMPTPFSRFPNPARTCDHLFVAVLGQIFGSGEERGVYRSRDGGASWESASAGLPAEHVYVTVLREAMAIDSRDPCGVYFGTSGGQVFASRDAGGSWREIVNYLPRILSVRATDDPPS